MLNIWIVVPTYNESANLPELLARIAKLPEPPQMLIVDDNSPDGTGQLAENLKTQYPFLEVLRRSGKTGYGAACRDGFVYALSHGAEAVGGMDGDLSHAPEDLPRLIEEFELGADMVVGSRRIHGGRVVGWGIHRKLMSWSATTLARLVLRLHTRDITAGFRLYGPKFFSLVPWQAVTSNGYAWLEEILFKTEKAGLIVKEVPVVFIDRKSGQSKLSGKDVVEFFYTLARLRRSVRS